MLAHYWAESFITSQIDIIVYDNNYPTLFQEGDFVIVTPQAVRAIIEVKTKLKISTFKNTVRNMISNAQIIRGNQGITVEINEAGLPVEKPQNLFIGLFSYDHTNKAEAFLDELKDIYVSERQDNISKLYFIDNIVLSKNHILQIKLMADNDILCSLYDMNHLAYSYFIANLLTSVNFLSVYMSGMGALSPFNEDEYKLKSINLAHL